jgi:hypothetical protein
LVSFLYNNLGLGEGGAFERFKVIEVLLQPAFAKPKVLTPILTSLLVSRYTNMGYFWPISITQLSSLFKRAEWAIGSFQFNSQY